MLYQYVRRHRWAGQSGRRHLELAEALGTAARAKSAPLLRKRSPPYSRRRCSSHRGDPFLQQAGVAGYEGLGALYEAPDGRLYQVQGLSGEDDLRGFLADEELRGLEEDEELRGLEEDDELRGLDEDEELRGLDEDEELRGLDADEELRGLDEEEALRG